MCTEMFGREKFGLTAVKRCASSIFGVFGDLACVQKRNGKGTAEKMHEHAILYVRKKIPSMAVPFSFIGSASFVFGLDHGFSTYADFHVRPHVTKSKLVAKMLHSVAYMFPQTSSVKLTSVFSALVLLVCRRNIGSVVSVQEAVPQQCRKILLQRMQSVGLLIYSRCRPLP